MKRQGGNGYTATKCIFEDFKAFITKEGKSFPLPADQFHSTFASWYHKTHDLRSQKVGFIDGKLVYLKETIFDDAYTYVSRQTQIHRQNDIDRLVLTFNNATSAGANKMWHVAYDHWPIQNLRTTIISDCISGFLFSLVFAFVVILVATKNWILSLIVIVSIMWVMVCMAGTMYLNGGNFGFVESTTVIAFIGISFDYVVHISH